NTGTLRSILKIDQAVRTTSMDQIYGVACTTVGGRPVAVSVGGSGTVHLWDLETGTLRTTLIGHSGSVLAVACTVVGGRPVAI
ncbi:hypothetical protein, partial [Nocardia cerradoensis]|uniref:hypothetical protein n=1 Tax=Nocardia cerradoensis TaxID=85688 RepID=UPI001CB9269D